jgi:hypothetical protein
MNTHFNTLESPDLLFLVVPQYLILDELLVLLFAFIDLKQRNDSDNNIY